MKSKTQEVLEQGLISYRVVLADLDLLAQGAYGNTISSTAATALQSIVRVLTARKEQFEIWIREEEAKRMQGPVN
jgi:hypothetical protein